MLIFNENIINKHTTAQDNSSNLGFKGTTPRKFKKRSLTKINKQFLKSLGLKLYNNNE